jgi:nitrogen fixation/metabolism regulation signal transduction histidine kinase
MNRFLKALVPTILLAELALITSATAVWALMSELHAGKYVILGAEAVDVVAAVVLSVVIFRLAWRAEGRMNTEKAAES